MKKWLLHAHKCIMKWSNRILCWLTVLAAIVLLALFIWYVSPNQDSGSDIVSALSILVTILMGWQVFNAIENVKTLKELDTLKNELITQRELIFDKGAESMCLSEAFQMLNSAKRTSELITDRYWNCMMAIRQFINGNVEPNYMPLHEAISKLFAMLDEFDKLEDSWLYQFTEGENKLEDIYDEIIRLLDTKAKHLDYLKGRIKDARDKRRAKCSKFRGMSFNDFIEYLHKQKTDALPAAPLN